MFAKLNVQFAALLFCATALIGAEKDVRDYEAQKNAPAGTKRIVFIAAKGTHGGRGNHEFEAGSLYFARKLNAAYPNVYAVVHTDNKWPKDLSDADAVVVLLNHAARAAQDLNIKAAMERGAGFAAIHFGVEVNKGAQGQNYLDWMGGYFETFWSVNPWWSPEIQPGKHATTRGVKPFSIRDEWYYHMRFQEKMAGVTPVLSAVAPVKTVNFKEKPSDRGGNADVLKAVQAGEPQHLAWAYERPKGGRGFGFTGFHTFQNIQNDSFRTAMLNGIAWVAGLEIPENGVASSAPTTEELEKLMDEAHPPAPKKDEKK